MDNLDQVIQGVAAFIAFIVIVVFIVGMADSYIDGREESSTIHPDPRD